MASTSSPPAGEEALNVNKKTPLINILNAVAFLANVFVMNLNLVGSRINSEVPATFPTLITPASWALYLWPVIVVLQLVWVILQLIPKYSFVPLVMAVKWNYIVVCVAQITWTIFFSYQILSLSFLAVIVMLVFLFIIFRAQSSIETSAKDYFMFKFPFSVLFGWIAVATFVDVNVLLVGMGVSKTAQFYVALVSLTGMLIVAGSISDLTVLCVLAWATVRQMALLVGFLTCKTFAHSPSSSLDWNLYRTERPELLCCHHFR